MAQYRFQVNLLPANDLPEDVIVNTFYLDTDAMSGADDPQALCDDACTLWRTYRTVPEFWPFIEVRAYNMSHAKPREPVATSRQAIAANSGGGGPREVALCLSYYADRNIPRKRGRMFIGPWDASSLLIRPSALNRQKLGDLANGISGLGGINVQWVQYSPTTGTFSNVTNWWVDDSWDTIRSRGIAETTRLEGSVSG